MAPGRPTDDCGIAAATALLGDPWTPVLLRDVARGRQRFEQLLATGVSRKVLSARLAALVDAEVLVRVRYQQRPDRYGYHLGGRGRALLPVLAALQEWGDTWLLGDGTTTADGAPTSAEARRVADLVGVRVPPLDPDPLEPDLLRGAVPLTVLYCYPGTGLPGIDDVPGGPGCSLEATTYRDRMTEFAALGARVVGVSTQSQVEQDDFAREQRIWFALVSDAGLGLTTALRLPTFSLGGAHRLKRLTLVVDDQRVVRGTLFPVGDVTGGVEDALALVRSLRTDGGSVGEVEVHDVQADEAVPG